MGHDFYRDPNEVALEGLAKDEFQLKKLEYRDLQKIASLPWNRFLPEGVSMVPFCGDECMLVDRVYGQAALAVQRGREATIEQMRDRAIERGEVAAVEQEVEVELPAEGSSPARRAKAKVVVHMLVGPDGKLTGVPWFPPKELLEGGGSEHLVEALQFHLSQEASRVLWRSDYVPARRREALGPPQPQKEEEGKDGR